MAKDNKPKYEYIPIDRYIILNDNDPDLFPIKIDLLDLLKRTYRQYNQPEPDDFPEMSKISRYGLDPYDQVFIREQIPDSLTLLEKQIRRELKKDKKLGVTAIKIELNTIRRFWEILEEQSERYSNEIEWIELMWYYRLFGKFIFINGKVTYLTGAYFWYLNFWYLEDILPDYRHGDMMIMVGCKFAELDTTTFKNIDPESRKPIPNELGEYEMIDLGRRVCLGVNIPKARRVGDTSKIECLGVERATRTSNFHMGIQGREEPHAKKVFQENFIEPFKNLPVFWKPVWDSALSVSPKENMLFDDSDSHDFGLHTRITHALTANAEHYNGDVLHFYHRDEAGNTAGENVNMGHEIIKKCSTKGGNVVGFIAMTTTVDKIEAGSAGENYMSLCMDSKFEIRNENGMTASGLYNIFISAIYRYEGCVDRFGKAVTGDPTPEQAKFTGKTDGSIKWLDNEEKELKRKKDWEKLSIHQRQYPRKFRDCFSPPGKNQFFQVELMRNRIQTLQFVDRSQLPVRGDFVWSSGFGSDVEWIKNENGRWYNSKDFSPNEINKRMQIGGIWYPSDQFSIIHSSDTFGLDKTLSRASMGGGAARWRHDPAIDPITKDAKFWKSGRLFLTYCNRPDSVESYCEDQLKANIYCGGKQYPERNKDNVIRYYRDRGYEGYLLYDIDRNTGKPKPEPGWWCKDEIKLRIFNLVRDEVLKNGERCQHVDWLQECCDIRDPKDMTNYDLFTAVAGTLLAEQNPWYAIMSKAKSFTVNTKSWIREEEY